MNSKVKTLIACVATGFLTAVLIVSLGNIRWKSSSPSVAIQGPTAASIGDILEFKASISDTSWFLSKTVYQWTVVKSTGLVNPHYVSTDDIFIPAGMVSDKYYIVCSAVLYENYFLWSNIVPTTSQVITVNVGNGPTPGPGPVPPTPPGPTPPPAPVTVPLWGIAIFDSTQATSWNKDQLYVHNGTEELQAALKPLDVTWKNYDKANPAISDATWQKRISTLSLPAVIFVDKDGKEYGSVQSDKLNKDNVLNTAKTIRGGK